MLHALPPHHLLLLLLQLQCCHQLQLAALGFRQPPLM
jgi:hypothetical protein